MKNEEYAQKIRNLQREIIVKKIENLTREIGETERIFEDTGFTDLIEKTGKNQEIIMICRIALFALENINFSADDFIVPPDILCGDVPF